MHVALPSEAERFLLALAAQPAAWRRAARAYVGALDDARVALAAASLRRAVELADDRDAAVAREVERRVARMLATLAAAAGAAGELDDPGELNAMRTAAVMAGCAVALRARLKPLDVALLVASFRGEVLPALA